MKLSDCSTRRINLLKSTIEACKRSGHTGEHTECWHCNEYVRLTALVKELSKLRDELKKMNEREK